MPATTKLANFQSMWDAYPLGAADAVKAQIGGAVNADWVTNTCVVRLSRSLDCAGFPIPSGHPGLYTLRGGDGKSYALRVQELKAYFRTVYGPGLSYPCAGQGGPVPAELQGVRGIICFDVTGWTDASGHFDLWNGERCANHAYFERASEVHLWKVEGGALPQRSAAAIPTPPSARVGPPRLLSASVGEGGENRPDDVKLVQALLTAKHVDPGPIDGKMKPATVVAIKAFQRRFAASPDGRVDVNGRTFRELNGL
jgi:hypothetical protein